MSRFYVGCRVRIVAAPALPGAIGRESVITRIPSARNRDYECDVDIPGLPAPDGCTAWGADFSCLEPITDPGREVVSWSECVWRPEHLRVSEKECQR